MCHINPWLRMVRVKLLERVMCLQGYTCTFIMLVNNRKGKEGRKGKQTRPIHSVIVIVTDHITIHSVTSLYLPLSLLHIHIILSYTHLQRFSTRFALLGTIEAKAQ